MNKRKAPKKSELVEQLAELNRVNRRLYAELDAKNQEEWSKKIPDATRVITAELRKRFGSAVRNLRFEQVDAAAYWYSFELIQDSRRQTWCVRHWEVEEND